MIKALGSTIFGWALFFVVLCAFLALLFCAFYFLVAGQWFIALPCFVLLGLWFYFGYRGAKDSYGL